MIFIHVDRLPIILRSGMSNFLCAELLYPAVPMQSCSVAVSLTTEVVSRVLFCVYTGMPESLLYCSLHDPVSPCPAGYVTNKVCSQKDLQGCTFVPGS